MRSLPRAMRDMETTRGSGKMCMTHATKNVGHEKPTSENTRFYEAYLDAQRTSLQVTRGIEGATCAHYSGDVSYSVRTLWTLDCFAIRDVPGFVAR